MPIKMEGDITRTDDALLKELNDAKKKKNAALRSLQEASTSEWEFERWESEIQEMRVELKAKTEKLAAMEVEVNMMGAQLMRAQTDAWQCQGKPQAAEITMSASENYEVAFLVWKAAQRKYSESQETLRSKGTESSISSS